ncbi:hypothetical protein ASD21_02285 [Caulobacter sp. Root1455]|uniref:DUF6491 family protein n=1 Tax=unclassified Caulobacter TaxID=2648921 RepID=UPI0006FACD5F|nr:MULTISPECIES: DUF6491 family protein [unclassified Caulobacter]KQY35553.1 hypothetical protein ASD38_03065 [Caulobacter sp. Root487D2Y]KQZ06482.1 hypothetical protein ASD21_02285 [Caulobacter sp. Root1455]
MNARSMLKAGLLTAALLAAAPAFADPAAQTKPRPARTCFSLSDWDNWSAPDRDTLYLKVRNRDVYQVDLSHGTSMLTSPGVHLVSIVRGPDTVCGPLDLDLRVSDGFGMAMPIMAKSITKLSTEQVAAIPKKDRP